MKLPRLKLPRLKLKGGTSLWIGGSLVGLAIAVAIAALIATATRAPPTHVLEPHFIGGPQP